MKRKRKPKPQNTNENQVKLGETSQFSIEVRLATIDAVTERPLYTFHIFQTLHHTISSTEIKVEVGKSTIPAERDKVIQAALKEIQGFVQELKNASIRQETTEV